MATLCSTRASADSLRRSAHTVGRGDWVRADAAVARKGLRAAGGARRVTVPGPALTGDRARAAPRPKSA